MTKPDNSGRDIAKSLHTVTVVYQVTRALRSQHSSLEAALGAALGVLELSGRPDPYGLAARALALLIADGVQ